MRFEKPSAAPVNTFKELIADTCAEVRLMFGCPCAFVNGNMCAGVFARSIFVRLEEADREALLAFPGAGPFEPVPGRRMREYVVFPSSMHADTAALRAWINKGVLYTQSLKAKNVRKKQTRAVRKDA